VAGVAPAPPAPLRGRLLLGVSGAVAASGVPELVARLQRIGFAVRCALTANAARFVSPRVLEAVTHAPLARSLWQRDAGVPHIDLAEWAELVLICPATATTIARLAAGDCDELVSAIVTATRAPVIVAPSMNPQMLVSPAVQRNLDQLRQDGRWIVAGAVGEEVAHAPSARAPVGGALPSWAAIADLAAFVAARTTAPPDWDALYAGEDAPPFCADRFDPDLGEALAANGITGGRVLDVGCGTGNIAVELARRGFTVTAIDRSPRAIARASARPDGSTVRWQAGDILELALGESDVVIDRGCLHALPSANHARWAEAMARATAPRGLLLVKTLSPHERRPPHTHAFTVEELHTLLAAGFTLESAWESVFQGPVVPPPRALFAIFRRR
jgi:2-polyprenyl-3-methyl-5-hydroxy-6-metoxy-1,4-benzoquinol methylase